MQTLMKFRTTVFYVPVIAVICLGWSARGAGQPQPILHWSFDDEQPITWSYGRALPEVVTREVVTGTDCAIVGLAEYVPGVSGSAMKFDGFSAYVEGPPWGRREEEEEEEEEEENEELVDEDEDEDDDEDEEEMSPPRAITVEAWVALGAYPWNWAPILTTGRHRITGFYFGIDGRGRVGFHMSDATSVWHECNSPIDPETKLGLNLRKWYHVVGTYAPADGMTVYVNGDAVATYNDFQFDYGIVYSEQERGFRIGRNRVALPPSEPIRDWATYPSGYSLDGVIDEIKIYPTALSASSVAEIYRETKPASEPPIPERKFPTVKPSGRFGANYTRLSYYPEWDALWPVGEHLDVVVQFDQYPTKLMFWRGTRYSACWVSENGKWMADQSRETGNNWFLSQGSRELMPTGCIEHMSDTQCRSSRVAIIENHDARCVINWRYLQMDVKFRQQDIPNNTGFGQWGNEYYYVYPDGLCVRKVLPGYGGWQETIFLNEPGTRPEDNVELAACTLVNLRGESETYTWEHGYPEFELEDAVIQLTNFKSKFKPFMIFREGGGFEVFDLEVRPAYSHFPWWNHWPVAQAISDGRSANAPDRASHSSLSWGDPGGRAALYGMTDQPAQSLVTLARSWNSPPAMRVRGADFQSDGYDYTQRAYLVRGNGSRSPLELELAASRQSPLCNLAIVVENWPANDVALELDGRRIERGAHFRHGTVYDVEGKATHVLWVEHQATQTTRVALVPAK